MGEKRRLRTDRNGRRTFLKTVGLAMSVAGSEGAIAVSREGNHGRNRPSDWTGPRSGPGRTGATDDVGPTPYPTTDWKMDLDGSMYNVEPLVADGTLYLSVTTNNDPSECEGYVAAHDPETGDRRWARTDIPGPKTPSIADGRLYFAARVPEAAPDEGGFYALDADTGETTWSRTARSRWASPIVVQGHVYTANGEAAYALDPKTGDTVWRTNGVGGLVNGPESVLSYADGTVFFSDGTALDAADGSVRWRANGDGTTFGNHAADDERLFFVRTEYVVGRDDEVVVEARSLADGELHWRYDSPDHNRWDGRLAVAEGFVFLPVSSRAGSAVRALDATTGEVAWETETVGRLRSDPVVASGTVYVGGWFAPGPDESKGRATVHAIDAKTGDREWTYLLDGDLETSPEDPPSAGTPVAANGKLYVATHPGDSTLDHRYAYYSNFLVLGSCGRRPRVDRRLSVDDSPDGGDEYPRPKARIDASPDGRDLAAGDVVELDASDSRGTRLAYEWDTDDDGLYDRSGRSVRVTVPSRGSVTVTLRISDPDGGTDTTAVAVAAD